MTYVGHRAPAVVRPDVPGATGRSAARDVIAAYVGLTKPRVIELLLLTTVPVMFFAAGGVPALGLCPRRAAGGSRAQARPSA